MWAVAFTGHGGTPRGYNGQPRASTCQAQPAHQVPPSSTPTWTERRHGPLGCLRPWVGGRLVHLQMRPERLLFLGCEGLRDSSATAFLAFLSNLQSQ